MNDFQRRQFIQNTLAGAAGLAAFPLLHSFRAGANDTIRIGFIGLGQQAINLLNGSGPVPGVKIVAGADVYGIKRKRFEHQVKAFYKEREQSVDVSTYKDYRAIIDRKDIDVVVIATPDHWHALMGI